MKPTVLQVARNKLMNAKRRHDKLCVSQCYPDLEGVRSIELLPVGQYKCRGYMMYFVKVVDWSPNRDAMKNS